MARLEIGTKIKINDSLQLSDRSPSVNNDMLQYRGQIATITNYGSVGYRIDLDEQTWYWVDWMFEVVERVERKCDCCGMSIGEHDNYYKTHDGKFICKTCKNEHYVECEICGYYVKKSEVTEHDDSHFCPTCFERYFTRCSHCNKLLQKSGAWNDPEGNSLCSSCFKELCFVCPRCGDTHYISEGQYCQIVGKYVCEDCYEYYKDNVILSYHQFNDWKLHETGNETKFSKLPMGYELEVECCESSMETQEMASKLHNEFLSGLAVYERDGSLNNGFEIITHPMTYDYLTTQANDKITKALECLRENGYKSHDTNTCGLHVHVSKDALATSKRTQEEVIDNIILIMETFKSELIKFSRRSNGQLEHWANFLTSESDEVTLAYVKDKKTTNTKYLALNLSKEKTIEFRIFKGTLVKETLYAALELVKNIVNIAKYEKVDGLTWKDIIEYHKTTNKYLIQYNNTREIVSTKQITVLDKYELNKENYSLQRFLEGKFAIDATTSSINAYRQKIGMLLALLGTKGVYLTDEYNTYDSFEKVSKFSGYDSYFYHSDSVKENLVEYSYYKSEIENYEVVKMNTILRLWFNNKELLELKENKLSLVA